MNYLRPWANATRLWQAILLLICCFTSATALAQTGVFTYGRSNSAEGGRVLVDDPANQQLYIGAHRNDSTLILLVNYAGTILNEMTFKADALGGTDEWLTDLKFDQTGTELVGCGILQIPGNAVLGGYVFTMTPGLTLTNVTLFPITAAGGFAPYAVEDISTGAAEYRLLGTNYPAENTAFYQVLKLGLIPVPGTMVDYDLTNSEGYHTATMINGSGLIFAAGRFAYSASPADYRPGIVQLNDVTGLINSAHTYLRPVGPTTPARLYARDIEAPLVTAAADLVTVGVGDFTGSNVTPHSAFWASHDMSGMQLLGDEITFTEFDYEGAHEVAYDANFASPAEAYLLYGDALQGPNYPTPTEKVWLASFNSSGTMNWAYQYGGTGNEYFSGPGQESQHQMIPINAGTARIAFTASTTSYDATGSEDILLVLTNAVGTFDAVDGNCIEDTLHSVITPWVDDIKPNMIYSSPTPPDNQPNVQQDVPGLNTEVICGPTCFAAVDPDYHHITTTTTFDISTNPTGVETWSGKYFIGADVVIDGIVLDVTETDVVFDHCVRITFRGGARLRANNSTFRPCDETQSWEGLYFDYASATLNSSAVINECVFKNAVEALRFASSFGTSPAVYDARITNNLFVNCWRGVSIPGTTLTTFNEGITGNTFTVDNRPILWETKVGGICSTFVSTTYRGINAANTTFLAQVSQNDFINTSDLAPTDLIGIAWNRSRGRITLNSFTNNQLAIALNKCNSSTIENNRTELTQLYSPFSTQILVVTSELIWVMGNHVVNSTENATYNAAGAAISMEYCTTVNVKENDIDGFTNGIQFYRTNFSAINENKLTNCNVVGIVVDGGIEDTVSCNQIKMRQRPGPNYANQGIFYYHQISGDPSVHIKSNCVTDASVAVLVSNPTGTVYRVPRMHNNYFYNYKLFGVLSQNFNGAQGSGIANSSQAARNTFVSNNLSTLGTLDIEIGIGMTQTWFGDYGIGSISAGVTLIGMGTYHSIASCGLQMGQGASWIDNVDICDLFMSNIDGSMQRIRQHDYSEFNNPALAGHRGELAATYASSLIKEGSSTDDFLTWIAGSELFSSFEKAWVNYHDRVWKGDNDAAVAALNALDGLDPAYNDFVQVQRIHHKLLAEGRRSDQLTQAEFDQLVSIDQARGRFSDEARDLLGVHNDQFPHILKPVVVPEIPSLTERMRDVTKESVRVFPNPAQTQVTVEYVLLNAASGSMRVYDATGRMMLQSPLSGDASSTTIDISSWAPGIYMVSIFNGEGKAQTVKLQVH